MQDELVGARRERAKGIAACKNWSGRGSVADRTAARSTAEDGITGYSAPRQTAQVEWEQRQRDANSRNARPRDRRDGEPRAYAYARSGTRAGVACVRAARIVSISRSLGICILVLLRTQTLTPCTPGTRTLTDRPRRGKHRKITKMAGTWTVVRSRGQANS